jgi:hypothetical protein
LLRSFNVKVKLSNQTINIRVHHDKAPAEGSSRSFLKKHRRKTTVEIALEKPYMQTVKGESVCSTQDPFRRRSGLTLALQEALKLADLSREDRKVVFDRVFQKSRSSRLLVKQKARLDVNSTFGPEQLKQFIEQNGIIVDGDLSNYELVISFRRKKA